MTLFLLALCACLIIHSFLLPLLLCPFRKKEVRAAEESLIARVSIVVPAYNEEDCIIEKLTNLQERCAEISLKYEVLIGSDGSRDRTVQEAERFIAEHGLENWRVLAFANSGKCQTINRLVEQCRGEIIVATDCDTSLEPMAIEAGVREFAADPTLGCLSSIPEYELGNQSLQQRYWSFDLAIRKAESRLGRLIVLNGWLYFFRRDAYRPIPVGVMADDLWIPLTIVLDGWQCRQCSTSVATCDRTDESTELHKRRRVIAGGMDVVRRLSGEIIRSPFLLFLIFSHKVNRWLLPVWLLCFLLLLLFWSEWSLSLLISLGICLGLGLCCRQIRHALLTLSMPFLSLLDAIRNEDLARWEHVGRDAPTGQGKVASREVLTDK
jgi:cellulose synthase/poly-beta-1,6-N-acetylglucosamine synthase-like glycosyltransferase